MTSYISNTDHYKEVISRVQSVKHMLWIGTADIKDLYLDVLFSHQDGVFVCRHKCEARAKLVQGLETGDGW